MTRANISLLFLFIIAATPLALAGGPLLVGSPTFGVDGHIVTWDNSKSIQYRVDGGPLGSDSNATAVSKTNQAFQKWAQVPGTSLTFQNAGAIQGVADGDVSTVDEFNAVLDTCYSGQQSPVIFDSSGIIQQLTGDQSVVGFTSICSFSADAHIQSAFTILRESSAGSIYTDPVLVHELGHFLGLDHTDVLAPLETGFTQADIDNTPTMFYMLVTTNMGILKADDKAWISKLYPSSNYSQNYGLIAGQILFSDAKSPVQDVLVIARRVGDVHATAVSNISGYLFTNNPGQKITTDYLPCVPPDQCTGGTWGDNPGTEYGSHNPALIGTYDLPVPPGQYTVEVRAFQDSGSIGPFDPWLPFPSAEEYWEPTESATDWDTASSFIWLAQPGSVAVAAGQTISNINIILNGTPTPAYDVFDSGPPPALGGTRKGGAQ